ncbi:hypothetical protein DRO69_09030 [Candidatus Bathyarchaeota archaeon]|nr:MAG: hypothetical protein DRO69_09030 [Candidatus Bathyarchaeota archaeon]
MSKKVNALSPLLYILLLTQSLTIIFYTMPQAFTAEAPQANFKHIPLVPYVNESITFDASKSTPGDGDIIFYNWNFGDNTTATGIIVEKSYKISANYTVTLTVTNSAGLNDTISKTVTVLQEPEVLLIDLYNQRGGQGRSQPSEDFAPGEAVELAALLTYNNEPIQYKSVSFEVRDAMDQTVLYRSAITDENGLAKIDFVIQAECVPNIFGTWTALAISTVSDQLVSDTLSFKVSGPYLDVYTQHPDPYSGKGLNQPSDAYAPQEEVILYGEVHYNCEPIEYKFVTFEVKDPIGETIDYRVNATDQYGITMVSFRLASNATFGTYTVFASVEILGKIANDTLTFQVGWIIENLEVITVDETGAIKTSFAKGEHVYFNLTAKNIAFTSRIATFTIVVHDEKGVPVGCVELHGLTINPGTCRIFIISIQIPKWAFVGAASVYANAFTNFPKAGGVPYCPEVSTLFTITP